MELRTLRMMNEGFEVGFRNGGYNPGEPASFLSLRPRNKRRGFEGLGAG